jgi:hypothetical protein
MKQAEFVCNKSFKGNGMNWAFTSNHNATFVYVTLQKENALVLVCTLILRGDICGRQVAFSESICGPRNL